MVATEATAASPLLRHPKSGGRKPLQPKNTNNCDPPKTKEQPPISLKQSPLIINDSCINNKENIHIHLNPIDSMDASLAEELTAVKRKLERLKSEKDKTERLLQERDRFFELQLTELHNRGEFQKELEIEVDRLYRLKQLNIASMRMSPIQSLRVKDTEKKKNQESQFQNTISDKSGERKEELVDECSTTESPIMSFGSSTTSSNSAASKSTGTWKIVLPIPLKLSLLESDINDK